jgi:hypothetical protein
MHVCGRSDLRWQRNRLRLHTGRLVASIEPDEASPGMWRVQLTAGHRTDMVNLTRARDAAVTLSLASLNVPLRQAA